MASYSAWVKLITFITASAPVTPLGSLKSLAMACSVTLFVAVAAALLTAATSAAAGDAFAVSSEIFTSAILLAPYLVALFCRQCVAAFAEKPVRYSSGHAASDCLRRNNAQRHDCRHESQTFANESNRHQNACTPRVVVPVATTAVTPLLNSRACASWSTTNEAPAASGMPLVVVTSAPPLTT